VFLRKDARKTSAVHGDGDGGREYNSASEQLPGVCYATTQADICTLSIMVIGA
jgi:hypothetical protein